MKFGTKHSSTMTFSALEKIPEVVCEDCDKNIVSIMRTEENRLQSAAVAHGQCGSLRLFAAIFCLPLYTLCIH